MKIELSNININFEKKPLLKNLSAVFKSGKLSVLLGSSGSGKTTILKIIAGVSEEFSGKVFFENQLVNSRPVGERNIGWVPQQQLLFPGMSVYDNIAYGLRARRIDEKDEKSRVEEISSLVGVKHLLNRSPDRLSGGERQRVAIARALAPNPEILLLDEPFSSLDAPERDRLALIMREVQIITGVTTIHVTHSPREAELLADEIFVLSDGRILQSGSMVDLKNKPITTQVASLIGLPNVVKNWKKLGAVIIPSNAIILDPNGKEEADVLTSLGSRLIIKIDEHRLEMDYKVSKLSGRVNVTIDDTKIIQLTN